MSDGGDAAGGGRGRAQRLPRWTRQEILVLIDGKRVVEKSGRGRGRGGGGDGGGAGGTAAAAEPTKWAAVAEYCRRHGVDRGPVQCRKRWSNLAGDYKKIREWEQGCGSAGKGAAEPSFWAMRNDARKEKRLPGFFDREVYDILEGRGVAGTGTGEHNAAAAPRVDLQRKGKEKPVIDSGARAAGGLFSSSSDEDDDEEAATSPPVPAPASAAPPVVMPVSDKTTEVPRQQESSEQGQTMFMPNQQSFSKEGTSKRKELDELAKDSLLQGKQKQQCSGEESSGRSTTDLEGQLIHILDRSSRMVADQLEAQNINSQLDREQRKDQAISLLGVLGKMADAIYRIADKL